MYLHIQISPARPRTSVTHRLYSAEDDWRCLSSYAYAFGSDHLSLKQQENLCVTSLLFDWQLWQTGGTLIHTVTVVGRARQVITEKNTVILFIAKKMNLVVDVQSPFWQ